MIHTDLAQAFSNAIYMTLTQENINEVRKNFITPSETLPKDSKVEIYDEIIGNNLRVRVYKPANITGKLPGVLWIHGGGHVLGTPEGNEQLMIDIIKHVKCIIAQPDYRLAPEFPYPADLDDCM